MRTLGHCQKHDLELHVGCPCGGSRRLQARAECRAMAAFRIEELQRMGWFACEACEACGSRQVGVSIYYRAVGYPTQLENWRGDGAARVTPLRQHGF